jgi:hypothetical protein
MCYTCLQSELPQTKFTHHVMRQTCGLIKFEIPNESYRSYATYHQSLSKQVRAGGYPCYQKLI